MQKGIIKVKARDKRGQRMYVDHKRGWNVFVKGQPFGFFTDKLELKTFLKKLADIFK